MIILLWALVACGPVPDAALPGERAADDRGAADPVVVSMRQHPVAITKHGTCRMACRHISREEVEAILQRDGVRDPERTRVDGECPSHALEGRTADGQDVRIVFAACPDETRMVTAIDLDREWPCDCL